MKTVIENVIKTGRYELKDMLTKLDTAWYQGQISYDERNEMMQLARENATPDMGYANIEDRITRLEDRTAALEEKESTSGDTVEYPEFRQPTCAADAYYTGSKVTENGKKYECTAPEGFAVTYPPSVLPSMWSEVTL